MTKNQERSLLSKFNQIMNAKYDNAAILGFLMRWFKQNPKRYTCVELVCELLESIGFRFEHRNMTPDQLFNALQNINAKGDGNE